MKEPVDDLSDQEDQTPTQGETQDAEATAAIEATEDRAVGDLPVLTKEELAPDWQTEAPVLCTAGRSGLDEAAATMLAQLLMKHGLATRVESADAISTSNIFRLDSSGVIMVCLSYLDPSSAAHIRYTIRRIRRRWPHVKILLASYMNDGDPAALRDMVKADVVATLLREAVELCLNAARSEGDDRSEIRGTSSTISQVQAAAV